MIADFQDVYEVEIKARIANREEFIEKLRSLNALERGVVAQTDRYFNHPARDFARTDEALRIRRTGDINCITYKGPKVDAATKTRKEIEIAFASGVEAEAQFDALLSALGFSAVGVVKKRRTIWELRYGELMVEASLDDVEGLGLFAEIETKAGAADVGRAKATVLELCDRLGLGKPIRRSYLGMTLESRSGPAAG